jgi:hypothetical protein
MLTISYHHKSRFIVLIIAHRPRLVNITIRIITKAPLWVPLLLSKVGNLYDHSFKAGNKCRLIIDKQEVVTLFLSAF